MHEEDGVPSRIAMDMMPELDLVQQEHPKRKGRCRKCGVLGHWSRECPSRKAGRDEADDMAHHVNADTDSKPVLLVAQANIARTPTQSRQGVYLQEKSVDPSRYDKGAWVFDKGATNHLTGCSSSLANLDKSDMDP